MNDLFKKRNELARKLASMTPDEVLKMRTGYAGKSEQWRYGFDLACREKQAEIDALKQQNAELLAAQQWQPIESAPRDGTRILVFIDSHFSFTTVARWDDDKDCWKSAWDDQSVYAVAYWQPLPQPPEKARGDL